MISLTQIVSQNIFGKTFGINLTERKISKGPAAVGETLDRSFATEGKNDVSVDRPDILKDINEAPEATRKLEA